MKIKHTLLALSTLIAGAVSSSAATFIVSNVSLGPGDTLYARNDNTLMPSGLVTMGYFTSTITEADIDTIPELLAVLATPGNYTIVNSVSPGFATNGIGDGYAIDLGGGSDVGSITGTNPLIGRTIYSIVTDALDLTSATQSNQFALVNVGLIKDDVPDLNLYSSNPVAPATIVIGSSGTFNGDPGLGDGAYNTLQMDVVPEPSAALLGAFGVLGLLRRRRA